MDSIKQNSTSEVGAVQDVITEYSYAVTTRDWSKLASVFMPDATWKVVGENANFFFSGPEVVPGIRAIVESTSFLVQINSPSLIDIDGSVAKARTILYEMGGTEDRSMRFEEPGIYEDVLHKIDGRWLFKSRHFSILHFQTDKIEQ